MPRAKEKQHLYDPTGNWYRAPDWLLERHGRKGEALWLPSFSTIMDVYQAPSLRAWYGKVGIEEAERIKDETAGWGTNAHALIERIIHGGRVLADEWNTLPEEVKQCLRAWLRWYQEAGFKADAAEQVVYSLRYGYAGTLDATGIIDGLWGLADWKTVYRFDFFPRANFLQLAAYGQAYREIYPDKPPFKTYRSVALNRLTGDFKQHTMTPKQAREAFNCFLAAKKVWNYLRRFDYEQERDTVLKTA